MTHAVSHSVDSLVYNMEQKVNGGAAARPKATPHPPLGQKFVSMYMTQYPPFRFYLVPHLGGFDGG